MAGLDHDLESVIIDLSTTPLDRLSALDDEAIAAVLRGCGGTGGGSARLWSNEEAFPPEPAAG